MLGDRFPPYQYIPPFAELERWSMASHTPVGRRHHLGPVPRLSHRLILGGMLVSAMPTYAPRAAGALRLTVLGSGCNACATKRIVAMRGRRPCKWETVLSMVSPTWPTKPHQPCSCPVRLLLTFPGPATGRRGLLHSAPPPRSSRKKSSSSCMSFSGLRSSSRSGRGALSTVAS